MNRVELVEFALMSDGANAGGVREQSRCLVGMHGIVGPHDVATDASGAAWVIENRTSFETNRTLVRLDPSTGQMRAVTLTDAEGKVFISEQIAQDQSGRFWFHFGGRLGRLDPSAVTLDTFAPARGMGPFMNSNDVDSRGRVWTNGLYGSFRFDPATRTFRLFQQATPADGTTYDLDFDKSFKLMKKDLDD